MVLVKVKKLRSEATLPSYSHPGDAGLDVFSCEDYTLKAGERRTFFLGISFELDQGHVALVWDRSGNAAKRGITCLAGVIDHTYRGEIGIVLLNTSGEDHAISKGQGIAQILIQKIETAEIKEVKQLNDTARGEGGFGSTGR